MSGVKGKSGRKKSLKTIMNEALELIDQAFPEIIGVLIRKALEGDREASEYLLNRRIGKPSFQGQVDIQGGEQLGVETLKALVEGMARRKIELESKPEELEAVRLKYLKEGEE